MGTHATTRIQKNGDYIEMHTRWDGFPNEIKSDLKNLLTNWTNLFSHINTQIKEKSLSLPQLSIWSNKCEEWIDYIKDNPEIEDYCSLLSASSFNHHHVLPAYTKASASTVSYWGYNTPDVVMTIKNNNNFSYSKKDKLPSSKLVGKPVDDEFFIARLIDYTQEGRFTAARVTPHNFEQYSFIDVKVKNMTKAEFNQLIFDLPVFWLELHTLLRHPKAEYVKADEISPLIRNFNSYNLYMFYSANENYDQRDKLVEQEKILDNVGSMIPFDFSSSVLANHLYLIGAGDILPLTRQEQLWSVKQNSDNFLQTYVVPGDDRTSYLFTEEENVEQTKEWVESYVDYTKQRFHSLTHQIYPQFQYGMTSPYMLTEDNCIGFNYELSMIANFHLLTFIDHQ